MCEATTTNGFRRIFNYDALGRGLETTTYPNNIPYTTTTAYDADHARVKETRMTGATVDSTTYFVNAGNSLFFEIETKGTITEWKHYLHSPSGLLMMRSVKSNTTALTDVYFHKDHLGSITTVTSSIGSIIEQNSYDAFGKRRNSNGSDATVTINSLTRRGFTQHEMLPEVNLIHMNGRVYEPTLGRFLSADPFIQAPDFSQSYNRYAYLFNNPLSGADPSGFNGFTEFRDNVAIPAAVFAMFTTPEVSLWVGFRYSKWDEYAIKNYEYAGEAGIAVASYFGPWFGALASAHVTRIRGGDTADILQAAALSYFTAQAFSAAGTYFPFATAPVSNVIAHAVIGCASAAAGGGECGHGAAAAGFSAGVGGLLHQGGATPGTQDKIINGVIAVLVGGTAAELGGGKFVNGALTAAIGYLFNALPHSGSASEPNTLSQTKADARSAGVFYSIEGCGSDRCRVTQVSVELIVDGARASSRDAALYDWGVDIGATILGGKQVPLNRIDVALEVLDYFTSYTEKAVAFGLGDKAQGLMANDILVRHTAHGFGGQGTAFTYTQVLRQDYKNPELWTRFRYRG